MPAAPTWNLKYKMSWTSERGEVCVVQLSGKNATGDVVELQAPQTPIVISWPNSDENKFTPVRGSEATLKILITGQETEAVGLASFIGLDDEWKVDFYKADLVVTNWQGFLVQDEHTREMQDEPYELELHAVDGLGILKETTLSKPDETQYVDLDFLIDYIGDALWKVNPYLKLVTHVNIFHVSMDDRDVNPANDPLAQVKVDAQTWLKDASTFEDTYTVLERILTAWGLELFQWNGAWHVVDLWDQLRGVTSFTKYSYNLASPTDAHVRVIDGGEINKTFEVKIAPADSTLWTGPIFPTKEDQHIGLKFANKSIRLSYMYTPWPDLPKNKNWRRGHILIPLGGTTWRAYSIDDWEFGNHNTSSPTAPLAGTTANYWRQSNIDLNGFEVESLLVVQSHTGEQLWLRSTGVPVHQYDKIKVSIGFKTDNNLSPGNGIPMRVYVVPTDGSPAEYGLNTNTFWSSGNFGGIGITYTHPTDDPSTAWHDVEVESAPIPEDGVLYIAIETQFNGGTHSYFRDFAFEYIPYIAGGYRPVKGDYHFIGQDLEFKQKLDLEIFLSDSPKKATKGAMYRFSNINGWVLTNKGWYRYTFSEQLRFGELQALKRFWHTYRTMQKIEGSFDGLIFFGITELPLGLLQLLWPEYLGDGKRYMLTDIEQDHKEGTFKGTMIESGNESDQSATVDSNRYDYIFE